ncbi:Ark- serine/threonine protein kinase [Savitreella phatthalungensis]
MPPPVQSLLGPYLAPGTSIQVGHYNTQIVRYLSEGGFSHVYIAKLDTPFKGRDTAVLKRIVAPDKHHLASIRTEVDTMKRLKGHRHVVTYIDSHASQLRQGGFEVYVLMEFCPGGGLIDFMNTRLQTRLAEWEVLKIFSDTVEAVACMHYLKPAPLLHRDLKIENVLISSPDCYKLCDFGSCCEPKPAAGTSDERRLLEDDIQRNTTIQYRSPEMIDLSRRLPIDEKSDIWALGVMLYKLCYFTTPFEAQGPVAILNAAYTFPAYPPYTDRTKRLIAVMLQEHPKQRPNIYQLLAEVCDMRKVPVPIPDIYSRRARESAPSQQPSQRTRSEEEKQSDAPLREPAHAAALRDSAPKALPKPPLQSGARIRTSGLVDKQDTTLPPSKPNRNVDRVGSGFDDVLSKPSLKPSGDAFESKFPSLEELGYDLVAPGEAASAPVESIAPAVKTGSSRHSAADERAALRRSLSQRRPSAEAAQKESAAEEEIEVAEIIPLRQTTAEVQAGRSPEIVQQPDLRPVLPQVAQTLPFRSQNPYDKSESLPRQAPEIRQKPVFAGRPSATDISNTPIIRPRSAAQTRPKSMFVPSSSSGKSGLDSLQQSVAMAKARFEGTDRVLQASQANLPLQRDPQPLPGMSGAPVKRSVSTSIRPAHGRKPSLSKLTSFTGTSKLGGKFNDAIRKFEGGSSHRSASRENNAVTVPLQVSTQPISDNVEEQLRASAARRSASFEGRTARPQVLAPSAVHKGQSGGEGVESSSFSMKEAMQRLNAKASAPYQGPKTASGYGKYTDSPERAATVIPTTSASSASTRSTISRQQHLDLDRSSIRELDGQSSGDTDSFSKRFPSLQDVDFAV